MTQHSVENPDDSVTSRDANSKMHCDLDEKKARNDATDIEDDETQFHGNDDDVDNKENVPNKVQTHQFWSNFRKLCTEFHCQIDNLLLLTPSQNSESSLSSSHIDSSQSSCNEDIIGSNDDLRAYYATAARRNEGRYKLDSISEEVRSLRRHVLSTSCSLLSFDDTKGGSGSTGSSDGRDGIDGKSSDENNSEKNVKKSAQLLKSILQTPMPRIQITTTDIRLMTQELDRISKRMEEAREIICPKEKFVFKRYRKAMMELEREGKLMETARGDRDGEKERMKEEKNDGSSNSDESNLEKLKSQYGGVLQNMSDCSIELLFDGTFCIDEISKEEVMQYMNDATSSKWLSQLQKRRISQTQTSSSTPSSSSFSYLLQNLTNVDLIIYSPNLFSLHLQNIRSSQILLAHPIHGPVHATKVENCDVRCSCYQLRIHDSKNVKWGVWVRSGPIIEDCSGMVFFDGWKKRESGDVNKNGSDGVCAGVVGKNMFWDVKDFNWLRNLRKSPNFTVITNDCDTIAKSGADRGVGGTSHVDADKSVEAIVKPAEAVDADEDSEDEL